MAAQSRIACLRIPRFQIAVHQKHNPSLKKKPVVLLSGKGPRAYVAMCSAQASRRQIVAGMKLAEARAVCADLIWLEYDERLYKEAQKSLCRDLVACSPRVSSTEPGTFLLDASGLGYLGGEKKFCFELQKQAVRLGFSDVHIGIADSAFTACVASKFQRQRQFIVNSGDDKEFLSPLSVRHLPISIEMQETLCELGIRTVGQMVSLDQQALIERFGKEGQIACRLSEGLDLRFPGLPPAEREFKSFVDLGSAIELINEIQFVLKSMIDRICHQLKEQGWCAEELQLSFYNDDELVDERPVTLLQPSNHAKFLLEVMRLSLEAIPLQREVTAINLVVSRYVKEGFQQLDIERDGNHDEAKPAGMSLTLMLQRFISRLGKDAVVKSVPNDQHIPERSAVWLPVADKSAVVPVLPVNASYSNVYLAASGLSSGLALRMLPAPQAVLVELKGETPESVAFEGTWYRVQEITIPERLSGLWWERPVRKSYYVALLQEKESSAIQSARTSAIIGGAAHSSSPRSLLVLLIYDHAQSGWSIAGIYD